MFAFDSSLRHYTLERRMNADSAGADPLAAAAAVPSPVKQHSPHEAAEREDTTSSLPSLVRGL